MNSGSWFPIARAGLALTVIVLGSSAVQAANDDVKALQETLALINQEQQAVFQQFQMIQQLRRANVEPVLPYVGGGPPGNYDEMVAARSAQAQREEGYTRELQELYWRYRDLDQEKRPIVEGLRRFRQYTP